MDADVLGSESVFELDVLNGCGDALVITLEWDTDDTDLDLYVIEPSGFRARFGGVSASFTYRMFLSAYLESSNP